MTLLGKWHKPRGPVRQFDRQLAYRCDEDMYQRVLTRAAAHGTTPSDLIRTYIEWGLENDQAPNRPRS